MLTNRGGRTRRPESVDSSQSTADISQFFCAAWTASEQAFNLAPDTPPVWLNVGGESLRLVFAGESMIPNIVPALEHLRINPQPQADLDIAIWDSVSTKLNMPSPPWSAGDYVARGEIRTHRGDNGIDLAYQPGSGFLSMLQGATRKAMLWTHDSGQCPYWERAAPLRSILHWWSLRNGQQLVHGAAVGTASGAILLTGKGGSGKSTTALTGLLFGLDYIGDDYVLCELTDASARVHSLFNTAKLDRDAFQHVPELQTKLVNADRLEHEKGVIFTHQHFPQQVCRSRLLRAIVIPRVTDRDSSRMVPMRPALAYLALTPTTVFQLPGAKQASLAFLKQLVERLPCYQLELGSAPEQTADLIKQFIEQRA